MAGRPTKYTPERVERIISALRAGNTRQASISYGGINDETFANWLRRYSEFSDAVTRAETEGEVSHVANIAKQSRDDWRASAWWLERRRNRDYGKVDRVEITIRERARKMAEENDIDADELIRVAEELVSVS